MRVPTNSMPRPARSARGVVALVAATLALAACNDDGRTMRPATPEQNASVSTPAPVTSPSVASDAGTGAYDVPVAPTVLPAVTTAAVEAAPAALTLTAPWADGESLDPRYTCDGEDVSPALIWTSPPAGTVEIAITVTDDDAPGFVHWALAALDPLSTALGEGRVPEFAIQGLNSKGTPGYTGPCPPPGETHTYSYTVYFLGQQTELADGSPGADLVAAIRANAFDSASVTATYSRS